MSAGRDIPLTHHGAKRLRKRQKCPKQQVKKRVQAALEKGLPHWQAKGQLKAHLDQVWAKEGTAYLVVYHGALYVFNGPKGALITMYTLNGKLGQEARKQQKQRDEMRQRG